MNFKNMILNYYHEIELTDISCDIVDLIIIDRWFPSSQICSNCGHRDGKKPLNIREWTCTNCGTHHDRDINASINILQEGRRIRGCNDL